MSEIPTDMFFSIGKTYRSGDESQVINGGDYKDFFRYFLATEIYIKKENTVSSQTDSFYYLYQLIDVIISVSKEDKDKWIISSGEQLESEISKIESNLFSIKIFDTGTLITETIINQTQFFVLLFRHCADIEASIKECGIDIYEYMGKFPYKCNITREY